eukprot:c4474_g1_i1.p3 GENE.c4474_g1_i1~~c4474_g1_i1.p3  ORF type:complete len:129 (+),score=23.10 c4474_g1_i1:43-429(+)
MEVVEHRGAVSNGEALAILRDLHPKVVPASTKAPRPWQVSLVAVTRSLKHGGAAETAAIEAFTAAAAPFALSQGDLLNILNVAPTSARVLSACMSVKLPDEQVAELVQLVKAHLVAPGSSDEDDSSDS